MVTEELIEMSYAFVKFTFLQIYTKTFPQENPNKNEKPVKYEKI